MARPSAGQFTCTVIAAGASAESGCVVIRLRDDGGAFDDRWFNASDRSSREILATALAAMSLGLKVWTDLQSLSEYSEINNMYVTKSA